MPACAGPTRLPKRTTVRSTSRPRASRICRGSRPTPPTCCRPSSSAWSATAPVSCWRRSPALLPRPDIHLEGPGAARLPVQLPVNLGDVVGIEDAVGAGIVALGKVRLDPFGVDGAVDHDMGDMA